MFPKPFFKIVRFNFEYLCMIRFFVALFWLTFYQIFPRGVGLLYFVWQTVPRGPRVQSLVHEGAGFGPHSSFFGRQLLLSLFPISRSQSPRGQNNRYKGSPRKNNKELPAEEAKPITQYHKWIIGTQRLFNTILWGSLQRTYFCCFYCCSYFILKFKITFRHFPSRKTAQRVKMIWR